MKFQWEFMGKQVALKYGIDKLLYPLQSLLVFMYR